MPKGKNKKPVNKDRFISKVGRLHPSSREKLELIDDAVDPQLFLRGDSVILVLRHSE